MSPPAGRNTWLTAAFSADRSVTEQARGPSTAELSPERAPIHKWRAP
jgi:hypothetical protein